MAIVSRVVQRVPKIVHRETILKFTLPALRVGKAPQPTGYRDKRTGKYKMVKEMIPEFVVPDLKGFELKPYVSYKTNNIYQSEFTAKSLFDATYGKDIQEDFDERRGTVDEIMKRTLTKYNK